MTGTAITTFDERWAKMAEKAVTEEPTGGGHFLTMRGGILRFQDTDLPGNQAAVIVLSRLRENTYYADKFDPDSDTPTPPTCYAFGQGDEAMAPHPSMQSSDFFVPQHATCEGCPQNMFGSADTGRGKACQNRARLAVLPAGFYTAKPKSRDFDLELFTDPKHYQTAEIAYLKLPPTSVGNWSKYVKEIASLHSRPFAGVLTRVWVEPHPKYQFHVNFEALDLVPDEMAPIIFARIEEAERSIIQPYNAPEAA